ncbi:MAG TPA: heme exporter protein CcmB [Trueperaceae bacterium]|nr:heme exporter protein CcmB [Trueperaceae bacterium]
MSDLAVVLMVARKDLLQELRSRATTVATLFFSATTLVLMAFALGRDQGVLSQSAPGVLWVAVVFAGVIAAAQSLQADLEEGAFDQLLTYPVPRAAIYLGKLLANWLYLSVLALLLAPTALTLYGARVSGVGSFLTLGATLLLGALGFAVIATFYAALTSNLQAREALLPVLMFPIIVPILLAAVRATEAVVAAAGAAGNSGGIVPVVDLSLAGDWVLLLAGFDLVYLVVCTALFHYLVEE